MTEIDKIKRAILSLNGKDKIYEGIKLSKNKQIFERGKPMPYLQLTAALFNAIGGHSILEVGCMRSLLKHPISQLHPECCNDGHSTYFWATTKACVTSIDISVKAVIAAKLSCWKFRNCRIVWDDALTYLKKHCGMVDLLYLDAWDVIPETAYAENHLLAYLAVKDKLDNTNIISIDDTDIGGGGKGRLLIPVLQSDGYQILVQGRQTIAIKDV